MITRKKPKGYKITLYLVGRDLNVLKKALKNYDESINIKKDLLGLIEYQEQTQNEKYRKELENEKSN